MVEQNPTYISRVRIVRERGPIRQATLPSEAQPVIFGTHDEVREHYGTAMGQYPDHATTLDYIVAAAAGWLCGTLGGALEARGIDASEGRLTAEGRGDIYLEDKVLVIKLIHVHYTLRGCPPDKRDAAERAHLHHASRCPVAKSIGKAIEIVTDLTFDWAGKSTSISD